MCNVEKLDKMYITKQEFCEICGISPSNRSSNISGDVPKWLKGLHSKCSEVRGSPNRYKP